MSLMMTGFPSNVESILYFVSNAHLASPNAQPFCCLPATWWSAPAFRFSLEPPLKPPLLLCVGLCTRARLLGRAFVLPRLVSR